MPIIHNAIFKVQPGWQADAVITASMETKVPCDQYHAIRFLLHMDSEVWLQWCSLVVRYMVRILWIKAPFEQYNVIKLLLI